MAKNVRTPSIRFKGFTDAWEQRKLGGISDSYSGGTPTVGVKEYYEGHIPFIRSAEINSETTELFLTEDGLKNSSARLVDLGDILYALYGATSGEVGRARIKGAINQAILAIKPHSGYDSEYLAQWLRKSKQSIIETYLQGGQGNLSGAIVKELLVGFPTFEEQQTIGAYFKQLDNLITLHQRKYEKLVNIKKALLEKMFPQGDEKVPCIRFKGFTEAWEQRKLGVLCEKFTDGDWIEAKDQSGSGVRLIQTGNIGIGEYLDKPNNKKWISEDTFNRLHCEEVYPGDILISRLPEPAGRACIIPNLGVKMITAVDCTIVRTSAGISKKFLLQHLSSPTYFNEVNACLAGGTRQRISRSNLAEFYVLVPTLFEEQELIGAYFANLDNLINLHQRQVEKLKNIKSALLANMFI